MVLRRRHLPWIIVVILASATLLANIRATATTGRSSHPTNNVRSPPTPKVPAPPPPPNDGLAGLAVWLGGRGAPMLGCPGDCHAQQHADLWGEVVGPSGKANIQPTAAACCAACKAHRAAVDHSAKARKRCNVWVHCGNASACGANVGHCYLKHSPDPMRRPAVQGLGWSWNTLVPWTAGVLAQADVVATAPTAAPAVVAEEAHIAFETSLGRVRIRLAMKQSPNATRWLLERVEASNDCRFYRAEPVPMGWGTNWFFGPPYALLQGSFGGKAMTPFPLQSAVEGGLVLQRGSLIMIDKGPDFLIGLAPHPEWATSYTHLGDIVEEDMVRVIEGGGM